MFYVLDENHNLIEAYDKEGVLAVLEQAIENGDLSSIAADSAFVDKLKCAVGGGTFKVAFVTQATYNTLEANEQLIDGCYYFITDDTTCDDIDEQLAALNERIDSINLSNADYRKKSEALQNLSGFTSTDLIYDVSVASQPKVDLSALLLSGKTGIDTVGVGGNIKISLDGSTYTAINFNTMWCRQDESNGAAYKYYGNVLGFFSNLNNESPIYYIVNLVINLHEDGKLGATLMYCINVATGASVEVNKMYVNNLMIYYK